MEDGYHNASYHIYSLLQNKKLLTVSKSDQQKTEVPMIDICKHLLFTLPTILYAYNLFKKIVSLFSFVLFSFASFFSTVTPSNHVTC